MALTFIHFFFKHSGNKTQHSRPVLVSSSPFKSVLLSIFETQILIFKWIPQKFRNKQQVFIHGESFEWSGGSVFDGTALAAYGDILVITINYRLGALGKPLFKSILIAL